MSKYFAIFIPILAILINTVFIIYSKNTPAIKEKKKIYIFFVVMGVLILLLGFGIVFYS